MKVKHTKDFTHSYFNAYPQNNTLGAIHCMLIDYNVNSVALNISDKNQIDNLDLPFIAHINNDFCVVKSVVRNSITYVNSKNTVYSNREDFFHLWTGVVLLPEATSSSIEPNFKEHNKQTIISKLIRYAAAICIIAILIISLICQSSTQSIGVYLLLLLNIFNLSVGYILLGKENRWSFKFADKFCSASGGKHCNSILRKKAKLFGCISWSELGISYFIVNIIALMLFPAAIHVIALISILVLPYTLWSIWYQKYIEKKWCFLCLITQLLLWASFIVCVLFDFVSFQYMNIEKYLYILGFYPILLYLVSKYTEIKKNKNNFDNISYELNTLKWNKKVFVDLLGKEHLYNNMSSVSSIILGDKSAENIITLFSNPYCTPCAKLEDSVTRILRTTPCRVQYIFVPLKKEHEKAVKVLISAIFNAKFEDRHLVIKEWHNAGNLNIDFFAGKYTADINNIDVLNEYKMHSTFSIQNGINATPYILFNGYVVPQIYSLDDIYQIYKK